MGGTATKPLGISSVSVDGTGFQDGRAEVINVVEKIWIFGSDDTKEEASQFWILQEQLGTAPRQMQWPFSKTLHKEAKFKTSSLTFICPGHRLMGRGLEADLPMVSAII